MTLISLIESNFEKIQSSCHSQQVKYASITLVGLVTAICSVQEATAEITYSQLPKANIEESRQITPVYATSNNPAVVNSSNPVRLMNIDSGYDRVSGKDFDSNEDSIGQLIRKAEATRYDKSLNIEQRTRIKPFNNSQQYDGRQNQIIDRLDFSQWLNASSYRANQVKEYKNFLSGFVGSRNVPPMEQLLSTARSWADCGYEPYQVPPRELWTNIVLTLRVFNELKSQGILPASTEIRSVYRSPGLNACAGGAGSSKHMTNGAIDVWVPEYNDEPWYINPMKDRLCQFWATQGESYNLGLGMYATGSIHLDTQGYRLWGAQHTEFGSPCRYVNQ